MSASKLSEIRAAYWCRRLGGDQFDTALVYGEVECAAKVTREGKVGGGRTANHGAALPPRFRPGAPVSGQPDWEAPSSSDRK